MPSDMPDPFNGDSLTQKHYDKLVNDPYPNLLQQVQAEYAIAWAHQNGRIQENLTRLKLFNNQKRDKDLVGDPLMFTIFQTVFASLYSDRLSALWEAKEEGDSDTADTLNSLSKYDADIVEKPVTDYQWIWDTLFFSRGLLILEEFDRSDELMCPVPENVDSMTWLRDPYARSVNGDIRLRGQMRFGGHEIVMTKWEMEAAGGFDTTDLRTGAALKSLVDQANRERSEAQGLTANLITDMSQKLYDNTPFNLLVWYTHWQGNKVKVVVANSLTKIIKFKILSPAKSRWPILDRSLYPNSSTWEGVSIPDLTEDKQRHRSVALNLGMKAMKLDLYPSYIYDEKRMKNKADLQNVEFNKFIPAQGGGDVRAAVQPLNKATPNQPLLNFILESLDVSAQRATATPDMQQGQLSGQDRTLGELNLVASRVDTRYSLAAKIFGWSERAYHMQWYRLYKKHFKDKIDEKVIRINGAFGSRWRPLTRENIIASVDPDVFIESSVISESNNFKERVMLTAFGAAYVNPDPTANRRYFQKHLAKLNGLSKDQIDRLYPPTVEELRAEDENDLLNKDQLPPVNALDDHVTHWEIHSKAAETDSKKAHMEAHKRAMTIKRQQPELFPPDPSQLPPGANPVPGQGNPTAGIAQIANQSPSVSAGQAPKVAVS